MNNNETPSADPAAEAEGTDIIRNPENRDHKAYSDPGHPNHKSVAARVESLFARAFPGTITLGGGDDIPAHINEALDKELGVKQAPTVPAKPVDTRPAAEGEPPSLTAEEAAAVESLRAGGHQAEAELLQEFGSETQAVVARAQSVASHLQATSPVWESLALAAVEKLGQAEVMRLLNRIGKDFGF
jgi:hypothetical protein